MVFSIGLMGAGLAGSCSQVMSAMRASAAPLRLLGTGRTAFSSRSLTTTTITSSFSHTRTGRSASHRLSHVTTSDSTSLRRSRPTCVLPHVPSHNSIRNLLLLQTRPFSSTCLTRTQSKPPTSTSSAPPAPPTLSPQSKQPLSEDILTIPNLLTMLRLALTPYIGYLVATHQFVPACFLLFFASITDLLDGWIARKTGKYTVFGSIADPAADKALVTTMVISLAMSGMLPWTVASVILGRDVALVISAFIIRYRTLEAPKTLSRYFNPKLPSATVTPTTISKYNTFLQLLLLGLLTLYPILFPNQPSPTLSFTSTHTNAAGKPSALESVAVSMSSDTEPVFSTETKAWIDKSITALMWIVVATTLWSGAGYLGGAGTGKVLAQRAQQVRQSLKTKSPPPPPPPSA